MNGSTVLPAESVRGRIRAYLERNVHTLGSNVLEVGSRRPNGAGDWADNRRLAYAETKWTGVDIEPGEGVDIVCDASSLTFDDNAYTGALCSEVLEHVIDPLEVLRELRRCVEPGGYVLVTTLTAFPIHGYPDDYWRFTPSGMNLLMQRAGFTNVSVESAGIVTFRLNDHGEQFDVYRDCPVHVFARGIVPSEK